VEKEETPSRSKGNGCIARSSHTHVQKHKFKRNVEKEETPSRSKGNGYIARSSHTHVQKHKFER
jgi:hypothetical protein